MVHFFGILSPGTLARSVAKEAPAKASFFGGRSDQTADQARLTRAEWDACYLSDRAPEPDHSDGSLRRTDTLD